MHLRKYLIVAVLFSSFLLQGCTGSTNTENDTDKPKEEAVVKQAIHTNSEKAIEKKLKDLKAGDIKAVSAYALDYKTYVPVTETNFSTELLAALQKAELYSYDGIKGTHTSKNLRIELKSGDALLLNERDGYFVLMGEESKNTKIVLTGSIQSFMTQNKTMLESLIKGLDKPKSFKEAAEAGQTGVAGLTVKYRATQGWEKNITDKNKIAEIAGFFEKQQYQREPDEQGTIEKAQEAKFFVKLRFTDNTSVDIGLEPEGGKKVYMNHKVYTINEEYTNLVNGFKTLNSQ